MKKNEKRLLIIGIILVAAFAVWTLLIQIVDVKSVGQNGTDIGFAAFNCWFHELTGVHMTIYTITDWLGLVPLFICVMFGGIGFLQLVKRKSLFKVDCDILLLGVYYVIVILCYLIFEVIPINYRPILIEGRMEASYPSSTTLLVLSVMPTLIYQVNRRLENVVVKKAVSIVTIIFSAYMVIGRLVSGVHWFTDIVGSIMFSAGVFCIYKAAVLVCCKEKD
ncbi:MAG: phosphatase PAP2 family protein [Lachnospira sp.]